MDMEKRQQDLFKMELLCDDCENRLSAWETKFANDIFYPTAADETIHFRYGPWFVKFAASLAWRALQFRKTSEVEETPSMNSMLEEMEYHLSRFLLGRENHVGSYTQHVYPVGELAEPIRPGSPNINRYLARTVEIDFIRTDDLSEVMVYVKLPLFIFCLWGLPSIGNGSKPVESRNQVYFGRRNTSLKRACGTTSWADRTEAANSSTPCPRNRRQWRRRQL